MDQRRRQRIGTTWIKAKLFWEDLGVTAEISAFTPQDKIEEFHVMLHVEPRAELFDGQLKRIYEGEERLLRLPQSWVPTSS